MIWGITGASGQLGRSLIDLLEREGQEFISWSHEDLDISEPGMHQIFLNSEPSIIINCAAYTAVDKAETDSQTALKVNRDGVKNVAVAAKILGVPLIHISTDYVFSGNSNKPWLTSDETHPISQYGLSKLQGEIAISETYPENSVILRTAWLYGPYGKNFVKTILRKALTNKEEELRVVHDQFGQPTSSRDLASQIFLIAQSKIKNGLFHATNAGKATWYEFAREILVLSGESTSRVIPVTSAEFPTPAKRPGYSVLDHSDWGRAGIPPMQDWRTALHKIFPEIESKVREEISHG